MKIIDIYVQAICRMVSLDGFDGSGAMPLIELLPLVPSKSGIVLKLCAKDAIAVMTYTRNKAGSGVRGIGQWIWLRKNGASAGGAKSQNGGEHRASDSFVGNVLRKHSCSANANPLRALGINFQHHLNPAVVGRAHRNLKDAGIGV
jgi:hypothetical protein